jgi:plastocyanin
LLCYFINLQQTAPYENREIFLYQHKGDITMYKLILLLIVALALAACTPIPADAILRHQTVQAAAAAPHAPRTLTVLAGAGQDTTGINAFLPATLRVRVGDTVTWNLGSEEIHTVTFLGDQPLPPILVPVPGAEDELMEAPEVAFPSQPADAPIEHYDGVSYANSGILEKTPEDPDGQPLVTFSLTFDQPGLYPYLCQIHPYMRGVVAVEPADAADLPEQADIDAEVSAELELLTGLVTGINDLAGTPRSDTLADDTQIWYVDAGANNAGDATTSSYEFLTKELTIDAGDTVVWASHDFHTVTFAPLPPLPNYVTPKPQDNGPALRVLNPLVLVPAKPSQVYDPAQYYNSGFIGPGMPDGSTWSLTFEEPGTYAYRCAVHWEMGMEGMIIVK